MLDCPAVTASESSQIHADVVTRACFASRLRVRILPRGSGREEPDQGIDPFAGVTEAMLELVKIFVIHPTSPGLHQAHELEATELRLGALASCRRSQAGLM